MDYFLDNDSLCIDLQTENLQVNPKSREEGQFAWPKFGSIILTPKDIRTHINSLKSVPWV